MHYTSLGVKYDVHFVNEKKCDKDNTIIYTYSRSMEESEYLLIAQETV